MSWKCIRCETSNSDSDRNCEACDVERFYTRSELDAELDKAKRSFQSPSGQNGEKNDRWKKYCIILLALLPIVTVTCGHYQWLAHERLIHIYRLIKKNDSTSKQLQNAKKQLESVFFVGPKDQAGDGGYVHINNAGLNFDVFEECQLRSVDIYSMGQGYITVELLDKDRNVINNKEVYVIDGGRKKVSLGFALNIGNGYLLKVRIDPAVKLYRNINMAKRFPYELPNIIKITNSTLGKNYYYFFYNWQISILC